MCCRKSNLKQIPCSNLVHILNRPYMFTLRSLAHTCSSTNNTLFSEHFFRQSHTARERQIKRKYCPIVLLGTHWLLREQYASLHFHAMMHKKGSVIVRQIFIPNLSCTGSTPWFFFAFGGITSCGYATLKLGVCRAASPWSRSSFPDSQWFSAPRTKLPFELIFAV